MRVILMASALSVGPIMQSLFKIGTDVIGVYSEPDKPRGRGLEIEPSLVRGLAESFGVPVFQPISWKDPECQRKMGDLRPDVVIVAAYGKILPPEILKIPRMGCLNIHPSLLPRYRGPSPIVTAMIDGVNTTGVTLMLMDEHMDTGPVLFQKQESILDSDTNQSLTKKLFQSGAEILEKKLPLWMEGSIKAYPQKGIPNYTKKITRIDGEARWGLPADILERMLRAYTPWPGLYTFFRGRRLKLLEATNVKRTTNDAPGTVISLYQEGVSAGIVTGDGILGIKRLQLEGRREVSIVEFMQGYSDFIGSNLPQ